MAVIITSPVLGLRAKQILMDAGISGQARVINAAKYLDWKELALNWILYGTEPEPPVELDQKRTLAI